MTDTRAAAARNSLARLLILAGVLAGLFAMHGLGDHGAAHAGSQHGHAQSVSMSHMSHVAPVGTSSGTDMGLMGLCLAVLAGTVLSLVRVRSLTGLVTRLARDLGCLAAAMGTTSRQRDPPCLTQLSILRC